MWLDYQLITCRRVGHIKSSHPDRFEDKGLIFSPLFLVAAKVVGEKSVRNDFI